MNRNRDVLILLLPVPTTSPVPFLNLAKFLARCLHNILTGVGGDAGSSEPLVGFRFTIPCSRVRFSRFIFRAFMLLCWSQPCGSLGLVLGMAYVYGYAMCTWYCSGGRCQCWLFHLNRQTMVGSVIDEMYSSCLFPQDGPAVQGPLGFRLMWRAVFGGGVPKGFEPELCLDVQLVYTLGFALFETT
jgi:hypothetical protein